MTAEQLAAMHVFKHELLAAAFRLYTQVPQDLADPILSKFFKLSPRDMDDIDVET